MIRQAFCDRQFFHLLPPNPHPFLSPVDVEDDDEDVVSLSFNEEKLDVYAVADATMKRRGTILMIIFDRWIDNQYVVPFEEK